MRWWIVLLCCAVAWQAHADLLDTRLASFAKVTQRKAKFTETFTASYLNKPVVSSGELEYQAPDYLVKTIATPKLVRYSIKQNIMTVQHGDDVQQIDLDKQPVLSIGINALRDLLQGNRQDLEARFWISYDMDESNPDRWQLLLIPRKRKVLRQVTRVIMHGIKNQIREMKMEYANGDVMVTRITDHE